MVNMTNPWLAESAVRLRRQDLLREAESSRLAHQALAGRDPHSRLPSRALARLGRWLEAWGWRLQERYSSPCTLSPCQACPEAR
jgi:hypothetical protein